MARLPAAQQEAALASLAAEGAVRKAEDERMDAESERLEKRRRARYANWPREKVMVVSSLLVSGPTRGAIDVASFLDQKIEPFGRRVTVAPRVASGRALHDLVRARRQLPGAVAHRGRHLAPALHVRRRRNSSPSTPSVSSRIR